MYELEWHADRLAAGYGTFGYEPKVDYLFGFPIGIKAGGVVLDIPMNVVTATNDGNKEDQKNFKIQFGILSTVGTISGFFIFSI